MHSSGERVAILGAGVVGTALGFLLAKKGRRVLVASRSLASARRAAAWIGPRAQAFADPVAAARRARVVFLTTPDRAIKDLCDRVARAGGFRRGALVLHTSGFFSSRVLVSARRRGAHVGSLHPIQSFASAAEAARLLPGSYVGWEGSPGGQGRILRLIRTLGAEPLEIDPRSKALYHAAAVLASNYTVSLFVAATELFGRACAERRGAGGAKRSASPLLPLFLGTASNLARVGLPKALTGPIARGDVAVVRGHLRELRRRGRSFLPLYLLLGRRTIPLALAKGTLRPQDAAALRRLFGRR